MIKIRRPSNLKRKAPKLRKFGKIDLLVGAKLYKIKIPKHDLVIIKKNQEESKTSLEKYLEEKEKKIRYKQVKDLILSNISLSFKFIKPKRGSYFINLFHNIYYNNILEQMYYNNYYFFCYQYYKNIKILDCIYIKQLVYSLWDIKKEFINLNKIYNNIYLNSKFLHFSKSNINVYCKKNPLNTKSSILEELEFFLYFFNIDILNNIILEKDAEDSYFNKIGKAKETQLPYIRKLPFNRTLVTREFLLMGELSIENLPYSLIDLYEFYLNLVNLKYPLESIKKLLNFVKKHNYVVTSVLETLNIKPTYMQIKTSVITKIPTKLQFFNIVDIEYVRTFSNLYKKIEYENKSIIDYIYLGLDKLKLILNISEDNWIILIKFLEQGLHDINLYFEFLVFLKTLILPLRCFFNLYILSFIRDFLEFLYWFMELIFFIPTDKKLLEEEMSKLLLNDVKELRKFSSNIICLYKEKLHNFVSFKNLNFFKFNFWNHFESFDINYNNCKLKIFNLFFQVYYKDLSIFVLKKSNYIILSEYLGFDTSYFITNMYNISDLRIIAFPYFYKKYIGSNIFEHLDNINPYKKYIFPFSQRFNLITHNLKKSIKLNIQQIKNKSITSIKFFFLISDLNTSLSNIFQFDSSFYTKLTSDMLVNKINKNYLISQKLKILPEQLQNSIDESKDYLDTIQTTIDIFKRYYSDTQIDFNINDSFYIEKDMLKTFNIKRFLQRILLLDLETITQENYQSYESSILFNANSIDVFSYIDNFEIRKPASADSKETNIDIFDQSEIYLFNITNKNFKLKHDDFLKIQKINSLKLFDSLDEDYEYDLD
jgi:hypothetical protein